MTRYWPILFFLTFGALVGITWANYDFASRNPGGYDFLVHWVGIRSLITEGLSPYSDAVATKIQLLAYGHSARLGENELRVNYPLYSEIIFIPFAFIENYTLARALWMSVLELALVIMAFLCVRLTDWRPGMLVLGIYLVFALLWYYGVHPVINGNVVILVALLMVAALQAIRNDSDEVAGMILGLATIKPHLILLFIALVLLWAASHRRWRIVVWTFSTVIFLTLISMFFIPDWVLQNLRAILRYTSNNPLETPIAVIKTWWPGIGKQIVWGITGLLVFDLLVEWWLCWRKDFHWLLWTVSITLVVSQLIGVYTDSGNFLILLLPMVFIFTIWTERWGYRARIAVVVSMLVLLVGLWFLIIAIVEPGIQPQHSPIMFFPLPLVLGIGLYWGRWWALGPRLLEATRSI
jgi:hypothetical protein